MSRRRSQVKPLLLQHFSGPLDVEIQNLGSMQPNFSPVVCGQTTRIFDYIGHALQCMTYGFCQATAHTSLDSWRILSYNPQRRRIVVKQIAHWVADDTGNYHRVLGEDPNLSNCSQEYARWLLSQLQRYDFAVSGFFRSCFPIRFNLTVVWVVDDADRVDGLQAIA